MITQIYEGTNQIQRMVMAGQLLKGETRASTCEFLGSCGWETGRPTPSWAARSHVWIVRLMPVVPVVSGPRAESALTPCAAAWQRVHAIPRPV
jgi:hypothetical protein